MKHIKSGTLAVLLSSVLFGVAQANDGFRPWETQRPAGEIGVPSISKTVIGFHPWDTDGTKNARAKGYELVGVAGTVALVGFHPWYVN